jgi:conjugative relaxase-like TrwC/TraI family protein
VVVAVMTLHKLTAGDGYLYLMRHVAKADTDPTHAPDPTQNADQTPAPDATSYYTAEGNPPGAWLGRGAVVLGIAGETVTEDAMRNLFGAGAHPHAEQIITAYLAEHARPGMTDRQVRELAQAAQRHAQLGRKLPEYKPVPPLRERVADRVAALEAEAGRTATAEEVARITSTESRRAAGAVAGFDLVFTPVKSLALLWAIDPRAGVREAIRLAHEEAVTETLVFLEVHAAHTRTGTDGIAQVDTTGLVAVAFTHYDSRAGDPNLHTHVAVSNKVQGVDGVWRALDARGLHALAVTASEHYNTRIQTHVADRLGLRFEARRVARGKQPVIEVAGISPAVLEHFSRRRAQLEARYDELLADYRTRHGRDPDFTTSRRLAEQANLDTRRGKKPPRSLAEMRDTWRRDLTEAFGPTALDDLVTATTPERPALGNLTAAAAASEVDAARLALVPGAAEHARLVDHLTHEVVAAVESTRSTWTVWNLRAETERLLRDPDTHTRHRLTAATAGQLAGLAEAVTARAVGPGLSLRIDPPVLVAEPESLRRADGTSVFVRHGAGRYTSQRVLDAEHRLLTAATQTPDRPLPAPRAGEVESALEQFQSTRGVELDAGQAAVVTAFATDPRTVVVGLGPAGTGKTTAMRALKHVLDATRTGRLIPLATSAHAASVLAEELGVPADNVHKFLHDHHTANPHAIPLRSGDVVLVDEAGMAGTPDLDALLTLATQAGARLRLLGDDRQLAAVESGGALRLLAEEAGAVELDVVHRFTDAAEASATLQLRQGDHQGLAFYQAKGRIRGGSSQEMADAAYAAWLGDVHAGKTSVLATTTTADVTRLAARARVDRVAAGQVEPGGVPLHDGNVAGVGDWVVTRHNDRKLAATDRRVWVRNGDAWRVVHRRHDGALTVAHLGHGARLVLPAPYAKAHVELLYATTAHRVQGATVDTAHALITPEAAREHLYVLATRARNRTHLYVATHTALPVDEDDRVDRRRWDPAGTDATVILQRILDRESAETSATQAIRQAQDEAVCLATLVPRYLHALHVLTVPFYTDVLRATLTAADFAEAQADDTYPNLITELRRAHQAGWQPERAVAQAARDARADATAGQAGQAQDTESGWSMTRRVADNLRALARSLDPPAPLHQPNGHDLDRYQALLAEYGITLGGLDPRTALARPALLAVPAFDPVPGHRSGGPERRPVPELTPRTYTQTVARALGQRIASAIVRRADWPALQTALRRAETAGHDVQALLSRPAIRHGLDRAASPCLLLDRRITEHLTDHPGPALTGIDAATGAGRAYAWTHLAWTMKAAENHGVDPAALLPQDSTSREPVARANPAGLAQTWLHAQTAARQTVRPDRAEPALPWTPAPVPGTVTGADAAHLTDSQHAIADRVAHLRAALTQAHTGQSLPEWTQAMGPAPRWGAGRERWFDQAATVAAFRDQYPPALNDPTQPLGPHPEPAPHVDPAHRTAHAHAALALALGYDLAHPVARDQAPRHGDEALTDREAETLWQVTADAYAALPHRQKIAVAATLLARLGTLSATGGPGGPDPMSVPAEAGTGPLAREHREVYALSGLDEVVTSPTAARHLLRALQAHGIIAARDVLPEHLVSSDPAGPRQARQPRPNVPMTRPRPLPRPACPQRRPLVQGPEQPPMALRPDYSPKPGARPQPGPDQPRPRW